MILSRTSAPTGGARGGQIATSGDPVIVASGLRKVFRVARRRPGRLGPLASLLRPQTRQSIAVDDVSFRIYPGERVGCLGPNGAGKSTTIKMLTGVLVPTAGQVRVAGLEPHRDHRRHCQQIGVVFGHRSQLLFDLPVRDSLDYLRHVYRVPSARHGHNVSEFAKSLDVENLLDRPVRTLSLGQRMRCELLAALLHEPPILFLDEPTIGLDVTAKDRIWTFIEKVNRERGVTVLLTTHDLADMERLCPRVMIIDRGRLVYDGSLQHIRDRLAAGRHVTAVLADARSAEAVANRIGLYDERIGIELDGRTVRLTYDRTRIATLDVLRFVMSLGEPQDLIVSEETIDALVRRIYEDGPDVLRSAPPG